MPLESDWQWKFLQMSYMLKQEPRYEILVLQSIWIFYLFTIFAHLLFFRVLIRITVIAASREEPRPSSPQSPSPAPPGYHWSNPWIDRKWNHSSMSWLWLGVSTQLDMPKTSPQGEGQTLILYHTGPLDRFPLTLRAEGFSSAPRAPPSESLSSPATWRGSWRRWSVIGHGITWIMAPV